MDACIVPYNMRSQGARRLSENLGIEIVNPPNLEEGAFQWVINWGCSRTLDHDPDFFINKPSKVAFAIDKYNLFRSEDEFRRPPWTASQNEACTWGHSHRKTVVCRQSTTGSQGRGIVVVRPGEYIPSALLFTEFIPTDREYRVHCFMDGVINVQIKKKRQDWRGEQSEFIRNEHTGYLLCSIPMNSVPEDVVDQASMAFRSTGLDFGAVDVIYNSITNEAFVLEVNSAPGLGRVNVEKYAQAIREFIDG